MGVRCRSALLVSGAMLLTACSSSAPAPHPSPSSTTTTQPSASSARRSVATATLAQCPPPRTASQLTVIARAAGADDVAPDGSGGLWISRVDANELAHVSAGSPVVDRRIAMPAPEGIVVLADGRVMVAEQSRNRVVVLGGATFARLLAPPQGQLGVDGIGLDATGTRLLVPDSPHGTLLAFSLTTGSTTTLATSLGRPVGVAAAPDGTIYVAAENPRGLLRIPAQGGSAQQVSTLGDLDDVQVASGLLYVTSLGDHRLYAVDPATGATRVLVSGLPEPQGLAVLPDGRLALADSTLGTVVAVPACG